MDCEYRRSILEIDSTLNDLKVLWKFERQMKELIDKYSDHWINAKCLVYSALHKRP
jgi:hypothetical protein